jgi:hypothetical protein
VSEKLDVMSPDKSSPSLDINNLSERNVLESGLFQESRQNRVNSWKAFQAGSSGSTKNKNKKIRGSFKPPKHKAESR